MPSPDISVSRLPTSGLLCLLTLVSVWNHDGTAKVEICQYEVLAEVERDDDGNELPLPKHIGGKEVISVEDGYIVGGAVSLRWR